MSSTEEPAGSPTKELASGDAAATVELKSTAKWLVGGSAATAAVLVAGLQLTSLEKLGRADWLFGALALGAAFLALAAAFRVLYQAAAVLVITRPPIDLLDEKDRADHGNYPNGPRMRQPNGLLMKELIVLRRTELLGASRDAIGSLIDDLRRATRGLTTGARVTIQGRTYRPRLPGDTAALWALSAELERRIRAVSDAAERFETAEKYQRLKDGFVLHAIIFLVGVLGFAWLTLLYPGRIIQSPDVTEPVQVEVTVPSSRTAATGAGLDKTCAGMKLTGAAVGGSLDKPIIVTRARPGCPARRLADPQGLIVVPAASK